MVVPVCFMVAAWTYAVAVNFVPAYRDPADKIGAATIGIEDTAENSSEGGRESDLEQNAEVTNEIVK